MACNENVIKNMANEITRNCTARDCPVDTDFVIYLIDLLLLNPKYGKLFSKTLKRDNLEYFVNECVEMLIRADTSINTLKMQHIIESSYDKLDVLVENHLRGIDECLKPLVDEILESEPIMDDPEETELKRLFRKISIYIILTSGLGNPAVVLILKEGIAALESVFFMEDLKIFVSMPQFEKMNRLDELVSIVSGVRLFNRDCNKGGEAIPDLPFNLVDAGKACIASLSNSLITVMQRVNSITLAIEDSVLIQEGTGNVLVDLRDTTELTESDYKQIYEILSFNRQYEMIIRKLLSDVDTVVNSSLYHVDKFKRSLEELHGAVKYKAAVPTQVVFPLFTKLWQIWRSMQNDMYLISLVNKVMGTLSNIQEKMKIPYNTLAQMLKGRDSKEPRVDRTAVSMKERMSMVDIQYLAFCAVCICVGALVPSQLKIGLVGHKGKKYAFCSTRMATKFSLDPERYVNEALEFARNNLYLVNLLNIVDEVYNVKQIDVLVTRVELETPKQDEEVQTEVHPIDSHIDKQFHWNLWEWKRRACQWANIVNCRTHSTQTHLSHMRSSIECQTASPRDKAHQTRKDIGINAVGPNNFIYGLRGLIGDGQTVWKLDASTTPKKLDPLPVMTCAWPCFEAEAEASTEEQSPEECKDEETKEDNFKGDNANVDDDDDYYNYSVDKLDFPLN